MITKAAIVRPARLEGLYPAIQFIPANSKEHLIEVAMGFKTNPIYRQEKFIYFLPDHIYYQQLTIVDGKMNAIKDDARTIVITGQLEIKDPIRFEVEIFPRLPASANIDTSAVFLPLYPELNSGLVIRDMIHKDIFYHFSCIKLIYRSALPYLQLRCLDQYNHRNLGAVLNKWHPDTVTRLENISNE